MFNISSWLTSFNAFCRKKKKKEVGFLLKTPTSQAVLRPEELSLESKKTSPRKAALVRPNIKKKHRKSKTKWSNTLLWSIISIARPFLFFPKTSPRPVLTRKSWPAVASLDLSNHLFDPETREALLGVYVCVKWLVSDFTLCYSILYILKTKTIYSISFYCWYLIDRFMVYL